MLLLKELELNISGDDESVIQTLRVELVFLIFNGYGLL